MAKWALIFAIAFEDYLFLVYHFRYPHMTKNGPQNGQKPLGFTESCHFVSAKAVLFVIALRTNFFVVYHFRYPHMTRNGPQNGGNPLGL